MCSIGLLKHEDHWLLFKNRDRAVEEKNRTNYIEITDDAILFKDKKMPGALLGINKHGLGIATAWSSVISTPRNKPKENFEIIERILKETKTAAQAKDAYPPYAQDIGRSYNLIIADQKRAYEIEQIRSIVHIAQHKANVMKTNHFEHLKVYNLEGPRYDDSKSRLRKLKELVHNVKKPEDLFHVLSYHSELNKSESICRRSEYETVASAIISIKGSDVTVYYALNEEPTTNNFKIKKWKLGS